MINTDDKKDMQELEEFWEKNNEQGYNDFEDELEENEDETSRKYSFVPILQMAVCAVVLLTLIYFKFADTAKYDEAVNWYKTEISQEIELPAFEKKEKAPAENSETDTESSIEKRAPESI